MPAQLTPGQRTAMTAKILMTAGLVVALEAFWRDSFTRGFLASALFGGGGLLLAFAKRAD
jgi:hypothetical protein